MKNNIYILIVLGCIVSINTHAWWSFPFDDLEFTDRSGSFYSSDDGAQGTQNLRIVQFRDFSNYYAYVELKGIKPEEVDIQRQGPRVTFRLVRGRMEENESTNAYSSYQSYSSFSRRLILPMDADPDISKMKRENNEHFIRLTIPKVTYHPSNSGY